MSDPGTPGGHDATEDPGLGPLLEYMRDARGFDFTGYKRGSLVRRIQKRMQVVRAGDFAAYLGILEAEPGEFIELFNTILINVTSFVRDREAWDHISEQVLPPLAERSTRAGPLRCWSAGCATGQEPYTLAIRLCETLGDDRFRHEVKIYATDADNDALNIARIGTYPWAALVEAFGDDVATRYFQRNDDTGTFRQERRRSLIFGRHDLLQDPPISRLDLLLCRNTLMYFTAEAQRQVLANFHFALKPQGYLFLGKAESLVTRTNLFRTVDLKSHVFEKSGNSAEARLVPDPPNRREVQMTRSLLESALDVAPVAQLVVDADENLVFANQKARATFGIGTVQFQRPLRDLDVSYRPLELRSLIAKVLTDRQPLTVRSVEHRAGAGSDLAHLDVTLAPFRELGTAGVLVIYAPVGHVKVLQDELERAQREVQTAYEELQSVVEELETTNEELQSTNEELETTNEELHSTNEELETMNEELQSTNDELGTVNHELRGRSGELDGVNRFLQSILRSFDAAVVVVSPELEVRAWNEQAEELWGLRTAEVAGQHFLHLDIGLPSDQLRQPIHDSLGPDAPTSEVTVDAVNRRGRAIRCRIAVSPLLSAGEDPDGVMLVMRVED